MCFLSSSLSSSSSHFVLFIRNYHSTIHPSKRSTLFWFHIPAAVAYTCSIVGRLRPRFDAAVVGFDTLAPPTQNNPFLRAPVAFTWPTPPKIMITIYDRVRLPHYLSVCRPAFFFRNGHELWFRCAIGSSTPDAESCRTWFARKATTRSCSRSLANRAVADVNRPTVLKNRPKSHRRSIDLRRVSTIRRLIIIIRSIHRTTINIIITTTIIIFRIIRCRPHRLRTIITNIIVPTVRPVSVRRTTNRTLTATGTPCRIRSATRSSRRPAPVRPSHRPLRPLWIRCPVRYRRPQSPNANAPLLFPIHICITCIVSKGTCNSMHSFCFSISLDDFIGSWSLLKHGCRAHTRMSCSMSWHRDVWWSPTLVWSTCVFVFIVVVVLVLLAPASH